MDITICIADDTHLHFAGKISQQYAESAKVRGTGIAQRSAKYISSKIKSGNGVIALAKGQYVGFCYVESFDNKKYVSNSGLTVHPDFRNQGIARKIKKCAFELARDKYPEARVFGITTSLAVMRINSSLGYQPVTFSELTKDDAFWNGCSSCTNYDILRQKQYQICLCTGMLAPSKVEIMKHDLTSQILKKQDK